MYRGHGRLYGIPRIEDETVERLVKRAALARRDERRGREEAEVLEAEIAKRERPVTEGD